MDASECRKRAMLCRQEAARSWGTLRISFLESAQAWLRLAQQLDRLTDDPIVILAAVKEDAGEG
jgi:hypothetical protein